MSYSRKYLNNTSSPVSLTITSSTEPTGYLGSVVISAYSALYTSADVVELETLAGLQTIDKYLNGTKVYLPGPTGYKGSLGYSGSVGDRGYSGSASATAGYVGSAGSRGYSGSVGTDSGYVGSVGATGYTGSIGDQGYTGSQGA